MSKIVLLPTYGCPDEYSTMSGPWECHNYGWPIYVPVTPHNSTSTSTILQHSFDTNTSTDTNFNLVMV